MTEEQIKQKFKETYPDFMRGDEPLSPYFDIWEYAIEIATKELQEENKQIYEKYRSVQDLLAIEMARSMKYEKQIEELKESLVEWQKTCEAKSDTNSQLIKQLADKNEQIEKMRCCDNCSRDYSNAETEEEEILCQNCIDCSNWELGAGS